MTPGTKGLVVYNSKLLLILRDNKPDIPFPNTWEYIGGEKEENENFEEVGLREIEEELGIRPANYTFLGFEEFSGSRVGRFIALLNNDEYQNIKLGNEGQKYDFFTFDETLKLDMDPGLKKFLITNEVELKTIIEKGEPIKLDRFVFSKEV